MVNTSLKTNIDGYVKILDKFSKDGVPRVVAKSLTEAAAYSRLNAIDRIKSDFTLRRKSYILGGVRYQAARPQALTTMAAYVGTKNSEMGLQEKGGTVKAKRAKLPIPTLQARSGKSASRTVAARYRFSKMGKFTRKNKFFIANFNREGVYTRVRKRLVMLYNLEKKSVKIKPTRWLEKSVKEVMTRRTLEKRFVKHARKYIKKLKLGE